MVKKKVNKSLSKESRTEGVFAIVASLLVLFSSMLDPVISVVLAFGLMLAYGIYKLVKKK
jgi:hypothetical protein